MTITPVARLLPTQSSDPAASGLGGPTPGPGKGAMSQDLGGPHAGQMSQLAGGEPLSRMMGHYKKGHSFTAPAGIRGGGGGMKRNPTKGALGPGRAGTPGTPADYSMTNEDNT